MNPSVFEALMLICFGAAWPFSICRMVQTKKAHGKSVLFLGVILVGYVFGMLYQYFGERNAVFFLYLFNAIVIGVDMMLTVKYSKPALGTVNP